MKDRSEDPSHHERTLLPRSYISFLRERERERERETHTHTHTHIHTQHHDHYHQLIVCRELLVLFSSLCLLIWYNPLVQKPGMTDRGSVSVAVLFYACLYMSAPLRITARRNSLKSSRYFDSCFVKLSRVNLISDSV